MSRLKRMTPADMELPARKLYAAISDGRRKQDARLFDIVGADGALEGPFGALLFHPDLGRQISELGEAVRYHGVLRPSVRELLILLVARDEQSDYEWYAHSAVARSLGISATALTEIRSGGFPTDLGDDEVGAAALYSSLRARDAVPDEVYNAALDRFGTAGIVEIVCLMHYYAMLAALLRVFEIPLPPGVEPFFHPRPGLSVTEPRSAAGGGGNTSSS